MGRALNLRRPTLEGAGLDANALQRPGGRRDTLRPLRRARGPLRRLFSAIVVATVALTAGTACGLRGDPTARGENISSVAGQPKRFIGRRVTLVGRIGEVISGKSFTITDDVERILVLDVSTIGALDNNLDGVLTNEQVQVTGVLRMLVIEEIESYVGELMDERYEPFVGEPVVLADAVSPRRAPRRPGA